MLSELNHVNEAMQQLEKHSMDPFMLPAASEQVIICKNFLAYVKLNLEITNLLILINTGNNRFERVM